MTATPRHCHSCGERLDPGDRYCGCGVPVKARTSDRRARTPPPEPSAPPPPPEAAPYRQTPPPPGPAASRSSSGAPIKVGGVILTILLFIAIALGKRYSVQLGEWMKNIFRP